MEKNCVAFKPPTPHELLERGIFHVETQGGMNDTIARQAGEGIHQEGVLPTFSSAGDLVE
jgi:hypothetical protein